MALHSASSATPHHVGHTEMLKAALCPDTPVAMAFLAPTLRVVLTTIHIPLQAVSQALSSDAIINAARLMHTFLIERQGIAAPRLAVAGLNPHAGEGGMFGSEEQTIIAPAVTQLRADGHDASGPFAPDTIFHRAHRGEFDAVVAMYHDQGLIPIKLLAFGQGVNTTLGLPLVRTSPDHGTAFDMAGRGQADAAGMAAALEAAYLLCRPRG